MGAGSKEGRPKLATRWQVGGCCKHSWHGWQEGLEIRALLRLQSEPGVINVHVCVLPAGKPSLASHPTPPVAHPLALPRPPHPALG